MAVARLRVFFSDIRGARKGAGRGGRRDAAEEGVGEV